MLGRSCSSGLGVVVYQGLTRASLYFYNADEAVAQKADLGDKRFRLQGTVADDVARPPTTASPSPWRSTASRCRCAHDGDPPELFKPGIPVVLEGQLGSDRATSSRATASS